MRIGISLTTSYPRTTDAREGARWLVERTRAARRAGLDSLFVGDHHNTGPGLYYQNVPIMGRLLAEWGDRPAGILALLPLWHPLLLAEQIGTLAAIAEGPFVLQCSLGGGDEQFDGMGVPIRRRPSLFESHLAIVQALLRGEEVNGARVAPLPSEPVRYWVGAMSDQGLVRAATMADGFLATPGSSVETLAERADHYRAACAAAGREPGVVATRREHLRRRKRRRGPPHRSRGHRRGLPGFLPRRAGDRLS